MSTKYNWAAGLLIFFSVIQVSCGQQKKKQKERAMAATTTANSHYDLANPEKFNMPDDLLEISGLSFVNGDPSMVYAEQDEDGAVFQLKLGDKTTRSTTFGKHGDYEDISVLNNRVFMLRSDGTIFNFPFSELKNTSAANVIEAKHILPEAEYEGLYGEASTGKLYALVKNGGKQTKNDQGYILTGTADGNLSISGNFDVDVKEIARLAGDDKIKFKPSALSKNLVTNEWYILSSINKMLVVADVNWKIKAVYPLNSKYLQPEGLAFDKAGNMYISNEGDTLTPGNILRIKYKP